MGLPLLGIGLLILAGLGSFVALLQLVAVVVHRLRPAKKAASLQSVSILKPLCGLDDGLEQNLERFANLAYPSYELLLGVRDQSDPAYPVALRLAMRWPERVRVVVQRGAPGLNPKINQLITLEGEARYDL